MTDHKDVLSRYLQIERGALLWKLEGLSEREVRWPMTPTGTNLLGLAKHVASVEIGYFGETFGRDFGEPLPWHAPDADPQDDMWATAEQSKEWVEDFYRRAWAFCDETIAGLELDSPGAVPWWPEERRSVTLQQILVHVIAETARHAGHADILREQIDQQAGLRPEVSNLGYDDTAEWAAYVAKLKAVAERFE
jgi:uncharacterized damage-inducible protein DinB